MDEQYDLATYVPGPPFFKPLHVGSVNRRREPPTLVYERGYAAERFAVACHIYDRIYTARVSHSDGVDDILRGVVDRLGCSQLAHERLVGSARGGDDMDAASGRQLGRVGADAAGCPHDQNSLAFPGVHRVHEVHGGEPRRG